MPRKFAVFFIPATFIIAFGFSNCGKYEVLDSVANLSSQTCTAKMRAKMVVDFPEALCEDISNFECERRVFRPGIEPGQSKEVECFSIGRKSDVCVTVAENRFDTEAAREGSEPSDFEVGGEYNREETQCWNKRVQKNLISVIQSEAETVTAALSSAIEHCHARSAK